METFMNIVAWTAVLGWFFLAAWGFYDQSKEVR